MNQEMADLLFPDVTKTPAEIEALYPKRNLPTGSMVTRFAPSPTGFIHLGSLYTSFICQTFAKQSKGLFYLRIEDTDGKRQVENGIQTMIDDLHSYEIIFDEGATIGGEYGPYIQSERKEIYQVFIKQLVARGLAYPCFMTKEELEQMRKLQELNKERLGCYGKYAKYRDITVPEVEKKLQEHLPYVIRLKAMGKFEHIIEMKDAVKGKVKFPENDMDVIIMKTDGLPTYHFAHVIDDHLMGTTHVIRGDEWLSSLPIHVNLFQTLHFKIPKYAHISPLTKKDGDRVRKLSKRHDPECAIHYYKEQGIPADALKLYFATLMNANFEQYYMADKNATIENYKFELSKMSVGGTLFDMDKLISLSRIYFSRLKAADLYHQMVDYYEEFDPEFVQVLKENKELSIAALNIEREIKRPRKDLANYVDMKRQMWYFYDSLFEIEKENHIPNIRDCYQAAFLKTYIHDYWQETDDKDTWYDKVKQCAQKFGFASTTREYKDHPEQYIGHIGDACEMIRLALTYCLETPDLYEMMNVFGRTIVEYRIDDFCNSYLKCTK